MPERLHAKVLSAAAHAARPLLVEVLSLANASRRPETPRWAKATIASALAYFVLPVDAVPDLFVGGYADDLSLVLAAAWTVRRHVRDTDRAAAEAWLSRWLGSGMTPPGEAQNP
jgi:uncharacterized membrane protein YkvA (DUF1232 family)